jgi:Amt family ammonium transporter
VFFMFQMTFAIITPALIVGAFAERASFLAVIVFSALWLLLVYCPVAHWVWGGGWLAKAGVRDFAGGLVVHATAGTSAVVFAILLGKRRHFPSEAKPPHSPVLVAIGAGLLWVGWYGFNAGSAVAANSAAGSAMLVTHLSASTAALVWMAIEWVKFGRPGLVGAVTGLVAGLATITPAAGSVGPVGALVIGALSAIVCFFAVTVVRNKLRVDDSLDVFAVHGVGGVLGTLILPFLATLGPLAPGLSEGVDAGGQFVVQLQGVLASVAWSGVVTGGLFYGLKYTMKVRVKSDAEIEGLDVAIHGERGYHSG